MGEPPTANIPPWGSRAAGKYTISIRLRNENAALSPFEVNYLHIVTWVTVDE